MRRRVASEWIPLSPWQASHVLALALLLATLLSVHFARLAAGHQDAEMLQFLTLCTGLGVGISLSSMLSILLFRQVFVLRLPEWAFPVKGRWIAPFLITLLLSLVLLLLWNSGRMGMPTASATAVGVWCIYLLPFMVAAEAFGGKW